MVTYVIPFRRSGKTRLGDAGLARAMLDDVVDACKAVAAEDVMIVAAPGGQGEAIAAALASTRGPVTVVNSDVPCVHPDELVALTSAAPAVVPASDGTTNALSIRDAAEFVPLYGPGSAARYVEALDARLLELGGLQDDVDTWDDLERVRDRVGPHTRAYLTSRG